MKIAHITDIHVQTPPRLGDLTGKRILGSANLYLLGRRTKFSREAQQASVDAVLSGEPDVLVVTGDLTAQALDAEFSAAHALLEPLLSRFPTVMIPGNHDTYVREKTPGDRMRDLFGPYMGGDMPALQVHGDVAFVSLETCRCHPLSSGYTPPEQLPLLQQRIDEAEGRFVFLCIHYPLLGRRGEPYGPSSRALSNASQVIEALGETSGIGAILHGHEHHGYRTELQTASGPVPILNPGSSGYARISERDRTAHLNFYEIADGRLTDVQRLEFDGDQFVPEVGGAYATGR